MTDKYPDGEIRVDAIYSQPAQALYKGNPVIEALPEIMSAKSIYDHLILKIPFDESERRLPTYERAECVSALYQVFQPFSIHIELAQKISRAIRSGYVRRNPLTADYRKALNQLGDCVQKKDWKFSQFTFTNTGTPGFSVLGSSGIGKSCSIQRVLSQYPQTITHSEYDGMPFNYSQIVWMKLDCPHDGSVKGLCMNFFQEFDRITGDNTFYKFASSARYTTDAMIPQMALLALRHNLGALIIDEIEFISAAKSGGTEKMLNFIISIVNKIGVPVVLVGIPEAISFLSSNLMNARRNAGEQGSMMIRNLQYDSQDWNLFIEGIWDYQWTSQKTELTPELSKAIWDGSYGIADVAVKLYAQVQQIVIELAELSGRMEVIDLDMFKYVIASDGFKLFRNFMNNLKYEPSADADLKFLSWSEVKAKKAKTVLPERGSLSENKSERNDTIQRQISIPRTDREPTNPIKPDEIVNLITKFDEGDAQLV